MPLQFGDFSFQFVLRKEMEWDSTKEEKTSWVITTAVSGDREWRGAE